MTKQELIELVVQDLSGGNPTADSLGKYDPRIVAGKISFVYDLIQLEVYQATKRSLNFSAFDLMSKTYEVAVTEDTRHRLISVLPCSLSSIPVEASIRKIGYAEDESMAFAPLNIGDIEILENTAAGKVMTDIGYHLEGHTVVYYNLPSNIKTVLMRLVPRFSDFENDDTVTLPNSMNGSPYDMIIQRMRGIQITPEDQINDNRVAIPQQK